jgi:hypothetical protein
MSSNEQAHLPVSDHKDETDTIPAASGHFATQQPVTNGNALLLARLEAADTAVRALSLAAGVIADGRRSDTNLKLRQTLLRESLISAVRALTSNAELKTLRDAIAALETQVAVVPVATVTEPDLAKAAVLCDSAEPEAEALELAEQLIGRLLRNAHSGRYVVKKRHRPRWWMVAAFGLVVATVLSAPFWPRGSAASYERHASSAISDYKTSGKLGEMGPHGLQFHTKDESGPWVVVDMLKPRSIDRVVIKNRADCCSERGLPLVVEAGLKSDSLEQVARQTAVFDVWTAHFAARQAHYVRIRSESSTILHLASIGIP